MRSKRSERLDLALCDRLVVVLQKQMRRADTARRTALNLVEIAFWALKVKRQLMQLGRMNAERTDDVGDICSTLAAELLEIADHSRDAGRALDRMLRANARREMWSESLALAKVRLARRSKR